MLVQDVSFGLSTCSYSKFGLMFCVGLSCFFGLELLVIVCLESRSKAAALWIATEGLRRTGLGLGRIDGLSSRVS